MQITIETRLHFEQLIKVNLIPGFRELVDDSIELVKTAEKSRINYLTNLKLSSSNTIDAFIDVNSKQYKQIEGSSFFSRSDKSEEFIADFISNTNEYLDDLPENIIEEQMKERFSILSEDTLKIKIFKVIKSKIFFISKIPFFLSNYFRLLFKKNSKVLHYWKHKIPYRSLVIYHLLDEFLIKLIPLKRNLFAELNTNIVNFWKEDRNFDFMFFELQGAFTEDQVQSFKNKNISIIENLENLKGAFEDKVIELLNHQSMVLEDNILKVGTFELPRRSYGNKQLISLSKDRVKNYNAFYANWKSTNVLLKDDWLQDIELLILRAKSINGSKNLTVAFRSIISDKIIPIITEFKQAINESAEKVQSSDNTFKLIEDVKAQLREKFEQRFTVNFDEVIAGESTVELLDRFEQQLNQNINEISDNRAVASSDDYSKEISPKSLNHLSPREIIQLEVFPPFNELIKELKSLVFTKFNDYRTSLFDIWQIADFTLEAAYELQHNPESGGENNPCDVVQRGIKRAIDKNDLLLDDIEEFSKMFLQKYDDAFSKLIQELMKLTENENVLKLKLLIVRAKAVKKAKGIQKNVFNKSVSYLRELKVLILKSYSLLKAKYHIYTAKFGLKEQPRYIASEASDFLAETNKALERLPYIYKRLFKFEPLTDQRLFSAREKEYEELFKAYKNWIKGRFAPVIMVGEKGSGITTILNLALKSVTNRKVYRTNFNKIIFRKEDFIKYLSKLFDDSDFDRAEDLIQYLNNSEEKIIVILENIQHLYLRTVNGFDSIKILFTIISATNKNVFWIASTTIFSWDYLNKTISVSDYFAYLIKLGRMTNEQIIELINKRHKISGFDLKFELRADMKNYKSLVNKSNEEINEKLKKEFYNNLARFAESNMSLALLYWIRAAKDFKGNTLIMNPELKIDVSFLSNFKEEKLFILHTLILHDGIDLTNLSFSTGYNMETCKLIIMQLIDDGILLKQDENYVVNPLVYRQLITTLKDKNILH